MKIDTKSFTVTFESEEEARTYCRAAMDVVRYIGPGLPEASVDESACPEDSFNLLREIAKEFGKEMPLHNEAHVCMLLGTYVPQRVLCGVVDYFKLWQKLKA